VVANASISTYNDLCLHTYFFTSYGLGRLGITGINTGFDEGAAQVKRLLNRDRKELMGFEEIGSSLKTEFDEDTSASTSGSEARDPSKPGELQCTSSAICGGSRA
jgi:hypothetical protein